MAEKDVKKAEDSPATPTPVDPDAPKLDETIPGGKYIDGDVYRDAHGNVLGNVSKKDKA